MKFCLKVSDDSSPCLLLLVTCFFVVCTTQAAIIASGVVRDSTGAVVVDAEVEYVITENERIVEKGATRSVAGGAYNINSDRANGQLAIRSSKKNSHIPSDIQIVEIGATTVNFVLSRQNYNYIGYQPVSVPGGGVGRPIATNFVAVSDNHLVGYVTATGPTEEEVSYTAFRVNINWGTIEQFRRLEAIRTNTVWEAVGPTGIAVGRSASGGGGRAQTAGLQHMGTFSLNPGEAFGVNRHLEIVGQQNRIAARFDPTSHNWVRLGALGMDTASWAKDINNNGVIIGNSQPMGGQGPIRSFVIARDYDPMSPLLGLIDGTAGLSSEVNAISDRSTIVGSTVLDGRERPARWVRNGFTTWATPSALPAPNGFTLTDGEARDINNLDVAVGRVDQKAVMWDAYGFFATDLNDLLPEGVANVWSLANAYGINDQGFIVGTAFRKNSAGTRIGPPHGFAIWPRRAAIAGVGALPPRAAIRVIGRPPAPKAKDEGADNFLTVEVFAGEPVTFDASDSYDPDGKIVLYRWNFEDKADQEGDFLSLTKTYTFVEPGTYFVSLFVMDNDQQVDFVEVEVTVKPYLFDVAK